MKPLVVDLDGTLIRSDVLVETLLKYFKLNIFNLFKFIYITILHRKGAAKHEIAKHIDIDVSLLPYNKKVDYMKTTWSDLLISGPSYNVNLTLRHENFSLAKD